MATAGGQPLHSLLSTVNTIIGADADLKGLVTTIIDALSIKNTGGNTIIDQFCDKYFGQNGMPSNIGEVKLFLNFVRFCNPPKLRGVYDESVLDHYFTELLNPKFISDLETLSPGASKELSIRSSLAFKFNNEVCYERTSLLKLDTGYSGGAPASATGRGRGRGRGRGGRGRGTGGRGAGGRKSLRFTYDFIDKTPCEDKRNKYDRDNYFKIKICAFLWEEVVAVSCPQIGFDIIASIHLPNLGDILIRDTTGTFVSIEVKATTHNPTKIKKLQKADDCVIGLTGLELDTSKLVVGKLNVGIEKFKINPSTKPKTVVSEKEYPVKLECGKFDEFKVACTNGLCAAGVFNSQFLNAGRTETRIRSFEDLIEHDPNLKLSFKPVSCPVISAARIAIQIPPRTFLLGHVPSAHLAPPVPSAHLAPPVPSAPSAPLVPTATVSVSTGMSTPGGGAAAQKYVPPKMRKGAKGFTGSVSSATSSFARGPSSFARGPSSFARGSMSTQPVIRKLGEIKWCCSERNGKKYGFILGEDGNDYYFNPMGGIFYADDSVSFEIRPGRGRNPTAINIRKESPGTGKIYKSKKNKRSTKRKNTNKKNKNKNTNKRVKKQKTKKNN